jgi:hypothetical protein
VLQLLNRFDIEPDTFELDLPLLNFNRLEEADDIPINFDENRDLETNEEMFFPDAHMKFPHHRLYDRRHLRHFHLYQQRRQQLRFRQQRRRRQQQQQQQQQQQPDALLQQRLLHHLNRDPPTILTHILQNDYNIEEMTLQKMKLDFSTARNSHVQQLIIKNCYLFFLDRIAVNFPQLVSVSIEPIIVSIYSA